MSDTAPGWITQTEYAKRRGCSKMAVSAAIKSGRLRESVVVVNGAPKIRDADLADQEWSANTDHFRAPTYVQQRGLTPAAPLMRPDAESDPGSDLSRAGAAVKLWDARMRELKYREAAGELVPAASVRSQLAKVFSACKTKLLGIPSQAKQALPHLSIADLEKLGEIVRESLEGLATGDTKTTKAVGDVTKAGGSLGQEISPVQESEGA